MRITIRNRKGAILVTFRTNSQNFTSDYERSKFFRSLHGWNQTVPSHSRRYEYRRQGLLDEIPHIKVADSVFIIAAKHHQRMEDFFDQWQEKVESEMMEVLVDHEKMKKLLM